MGLFFVDDPMSTSSNPLSPQDRCSLIHKIYVALIQRTESFAQTPDMVSEAMYLVGVISADSFQVVDWSYSPGEDRYSEVFEMVKNTFEANSPIWKFIIREIETEN